MIRKARVDDIAPLIEVLERLHRESSFREVEFDRGVLDAFLQRAVVEPTVVCLIGGRSDAVEAVYLGYVSAYFFSREKAAWDLLFYVIPERRGGSMARRLFEAAKDWANAQGARRFHLSVSTGIEPQKTGRFLEKLGMLPTGGNFFMSLRDVVDPVLHAAQCRLRD